MLVTAQKFQSQWGCRGNCGHGATIERHSLSQPYRACQLPQRGSRERAVPFNMPPKNRNVAGDFHRPYETLMILDFTIHRRTLPQLRCAQQLPQRGSRGRAAPLIVPPGNRNIAGDFHRPYGTLNVLLFSLKLYYAIIIPQTPGVGICGISVFTTCLICTGGCVRLVRCLPFGPAGGLRYCRRLQWQIADYPLRRISPNQSLQVLRC